MEIAGFKGLPRPSWLVLSNQILRFQKAINFVHIEATDANFGGIVLEKQYPGRGLRQSVNFISLSS